MRLALPALALLAPLWAQQRDPFTAQQRRYWAFQPVRRPAVPQPGNTAWVTNPVDAFVLQKLRAKSLSPSPEAPRAKLVRRAYLDLLGIPPTPDQARQFIDDPSPRAWDDLVDRLLASPQYGERWARHWLDLARYSDSTGFEDDVTRPNVWRYRDYVIRAFNSDKPYNRFVREQVAGDELWPDDLDARVATGFNRHYPEEGNQKDLLLGRQEMLHEVTSVTGAVFLGLTFECARCHNHKFDPILQRDYYSLQAFFANTNHDDRLPLVDPATLRDHHRRMAAWEAKTQPIWDEMSALLMPQRTFTPQQLLERYPDYAVRAIKAGESERTPLQAWMAHLLSSKTCNTCPLRPKPYLDPGFLSVANKLKGAEKKRFEELQAELAKLAPLKPAEIPRASGMVDVGPVAPPTHVLGVGQHTAPGEEVEPAFPAILGGGTARAAPVGRSTGRRSALANWLADPSNPLVGRVMVNRLWHHHFGSGIVATPGDFGVMGARPSHPELLDWLTDEFVRSNWSVKHVHRLIMRSSAYRQDSVGVDAARGVDPDNKLLWRYQPQRIEAESVRDSALAVSGMLSPAMGGPGVFPPLPDGMAKPVGGWDASPSPLDQHKRSVYIFVRRNEPYPMLNTIDFPDSHESCPRRSQTTTAPQALTLLNSKLTAEWSGRFADRVAREAGSAPARQVEAAYQIAYSRRPDPWEMDTALTFLAKGGGALADFCLMLINSNEFVYRF